MKTKGKVHNALSLMFQHKGFSPLVVMDSSKEQTLGKFARNFEMLAVRNGPQNLTLRGRTLLSTISRNSREAKVRSCSLPTCPEDSVMIAWNMRPVYDYIWPTTFSS